MKESALKPTAKSIYDDCTQNELNALQTPANDAVDISNDYITTDKIPAKTSIFQDE